eukprot:351012-Chlamydomonas_euryale.AAC.9
MNTYKDVAVRRHTTANALDINMQPDICLTVLMHQSCLPTAEIDHNAKENVCNICTSIICDERLGDAEVQHQCYAVHNVDDGGSTSHGWVHLQLHRHQSQKSSKAIRPKTDSWHLWGHHSGNVRLDSVRTQSQCENAHTEGAAHGQAKGCFFHGNHGNLFEVSCSNARDQTTAQVVCASALPP